MGNKNNTLSNVLNHDDNKQLKQQLTQYIQLHLEHLKHRTYKCYKCHKRGHVSSECENICQKCGVAHSERFCIGDITSLIVELNYVQCSLLRSFREDCKRKTSVEIVKLMDNYVRKVSERIEKFEKEQKPGKRAKPTNDIFRDFINLFQLRGIESVCQSHSETIKAYRAKIEQLKLESQKLYQERSAVIKEEQNRFMEAKRKGIRALIDYKLSKAKFRNKMSYAENRIKDEFHKYKTEMEELCAFDRYKRLEQSNKGYMHVSRTGSVNARIIASGINSQVATDEINKLTKLQNITNSMLALLNEATKKSFLNPRFDDLAQQFEEIDSKLQHSINSNVGNLRVIHLDKSDASQIIIRNYENEIRVAQSYIRLAMKQAKDIKSSATRSLYSA